MIEEEKPSKWTLLGATLLMGGTCIGGGMLALPVATGILGFVPSLGVMLLCWVMMTLTGLLLAEVSLWLPEGAHIISMADAFLGRWGRIVAWVLYLFISYASIVAYTAGAGSQVELWFQHTLGLSLSYEWACAIFLVGFTLAVFLGSEAVGRLNTILFFAMLGAYFCLVGGGLPLVDTELLAYRSTSGLALSIPLLLTAFSFQAIVPSMTPLLKGHRASLRIAILGGTAVALGVYLLWELLVLGIVPVEGESGLRQAFLQGEPPTKFLTAAIGRPWVADVAEFFSFFAIVTSFLGMTLGLYDFLADGLHVPKKAWGNIVLGVLIVVPTLFFSTHFTRVFMVALDTSGGFGDAILNGVMPVMMIWVGRYYRKLEGEPLVPGGKWSLGFIALFFLGVFCLEFLSQSGLLCCEPPTPTLD